MKFLVILIYRHINCTLFETWQLVLNFEPIVKLQRNFTKQNTHKSNLIEAHRVVLTTISNTKSLK